MAYTLSLFGYGYGMQPRTTASIRKAHHRGCALAPDPHGSSAHHAIRTQSTVVPWCVRRH
eukprot:scaffold302423_cov39-Tisochrysis_lutea.AAC.1